MFIRQNISAPKVQNISAATYGISTNILDRTRLVSGESNTVTVQDIVYQHYIPAIYANDKQVAISSTQSISPCYTSETPDVVSVNPQGYITVLQSGSAIVSVTMGPIKQHIKFDAILPTIPDEEGVMIFDSWATGSLAKNCSDAVDTRLSGKSATTALKIFTTQNHNASIYTRNTNVWCSDLVQKLTCLSPWNSMDANRRAGTLVTPRHIIMAAHYEIAEGSTVRFVTSDNTVIDRMLLKKKHHPAFSVAYPDICIGVLDSNLPESITPCKVLPDTYESYLPHMNVGIPALCLDQEEKALVTDLVYDNTTQATFAIPHDSKRLEFFENKIVGDSGNPSFLIINNELALITVWTWGGAGGGTSINDFIADTNQLIADVDTLAGVSTGYTLTQIDLSGFTSF